MSVGMISGIEERPQPTEKPAIQAQLMLGWGQHLLHEELPHAELCRLQRALCAEPWNVQRLAILAACLIWRRRCWHRRLPKRLGHCHEMLQAKKHIKHETGYAKSA